MALIGHALDNGVYSPQTQLALVQCFSVVFGQTRWWREMLDDDPEIAALVQIATKQTMH